MPSMLHLALLVWIHSWNMDAAWARKVRAPGLSLVHMLMWGRWYSVLVLSGRAACSTVSIACDGELSLQASLRHFLEVALSLRTWSRLQLQMTKAGRSPEVTEETAGMWEAIHKWAVWSGQHETAAGAGVK